MKRTRRGANRDEIAAIRTIIGDRHEGWLSLLRDSNGNIPETNEFDVGLTNGSGVTRFWSVAEVVAMRAKLADRLSQALVAIADAEGGNYVCLGLSDAVSGVYFWDHETEEASKIADSFTAFMRDLRPFDPDSIELKPGQVISAWIDPSLVNKK